MTDTADAFKFMTGLDRDEVTVTVHRRGEPPARVILTEDEERAIADSAHLEYMTDVLRIFAEADYVDGGLTWRMEDGRIRFAAMCSDTFAWGCADAEPIGYDDIPALQQCLTDLQESGWIGVAYLPELYAARKRGTRPMNCFLYPKRGDQMPASTQALFEACGPERESVFGAP